MGELVLIMGRDPLWQLGGGESYVTAHALAAKAAGHEPHVFGLGPAPGGTKVARFGTVHRCLSPIPVVRIITTRLQRRWLCRPVVEFLADRPGPHVIHAFATWADTAVAVSRALERRGVVAVPIATAWSTIEHESVAKRGSGVLRRHPLLWLMYLLEVVWVRAFAKHVERRAYRACRRVLVNYESVASLLRAAYGEEVAIQRIPYCTATAFDSEPAASPPEFRGDPQAPLIVAVSRHDGRKGLDVLINALAGLRDAGVPFRACLVGTGHLLAAHRLLVDRLGLGDRVELPGAVPEVMPYLRSSDVFVLPSLEEGSGSLAVLEALQAATAIVASGIDGIPEDLTDGHDALLVAPGDPGALQDALARLLCDRPLRERLAAAARETYLRDFQPARVTEALGELYAELGLMPAG
jgi:glycosyltransferase involved in cell wall biosynthesis